MIKLMWAVFCFFVIFHFVRGFEKFSKFSLSDTADIQQGSSDRDKCDGVRVWNNYTEENSFKVGLYGEHWVRKGGT